MLYLKKLCLFGLLLFQITHVMEQRDYFLGKYASNIDAIPVLCATIITQLSCQPPIFSPKLQYKYQSTSIKYIDYQLCDILLLKNNNWYKKICASYYIDHTASEMILCNPTDEKISFEEARKNYETIIKDFKMNWTFGTLAQYPEIGIKKAENDWVLILKTDPKMSEVVLLRLLLIKFDLEHCTELDTFWISENQQTYQGDLYLWIKRDQFQKINTLFSIFPTNSTQQNFIL